MGRRTGRATKMGGRLEVQPAPISLTIGWQTNPQPEFVGSYFSQMVPLVPASWEQIPYCTFCRLLGRGAPTCTAADNTQAEPEKALRPSNTHIRPHPVALPERSQAQAGVVASRMTTDTPPTDQKMAAPPPHPSQCPRCTHRRNRRARRARRVAGARHGGCPRGAGGPGGYRVACSWHPPPPDDARPRAGLRPTPPIRPATPPQLTVPASVAAPPRPPPVAVPQRAETRRPPVRAARDAPLPSPPPPTGGACGCRRTNARVLRGLPSPLHPPPILSAPRRSPPLPSRTRHHHPLPPPPHPPPPPAPGRGRPRRQLGVFPPPALGAGRAACHARRADAAAAWWLAPPVTAGGGGLFYLSPFILPSRASHPAAAVCRQSWLAGCSHRVCGCAESSRHPRGHGRDWPRLFQPPRPPHASI